MDRKPEKQLQHRRVINSSRKQREKTVRQRPGERKRRRRERDGASAPVFPGPQGRPLFRRAHNQLNCYQSAGIKKPLSGLLIISGIIALFTPGFGYAATQESDNECKKATDHQHGLQNQSRFFHRVRY